MQGVGATVRPAKKILVSISFNGVVDGFTIRAACWGEPVLGNAHPQTRMGPTSARRSEICGQFFFFFFFRINLAKTAGGGVARRVLPAQTACPERIRGEKARATCPFREAVV